MTMYFTYFAAFTYVTYAAHSWAAAEVTVYSIETQDKDKQEKKEKRDKQKKGEKEEKEKKKKKQLKTDKIKIFPKTPAASTTKKNLSQPTKKFTGEKGDFIFYDADLQNVLLFFAKQYKLNMIIDPGVSGKVTCRMIQVPWDQALDVILRQHGLTMVIERTITRAKKLKE
jgi:hypothetical protein